MIYAFAALIGWCGAFCTIQRILSPRPVPWISGPHPDPWAYGARPEPWLRLLASLLGAAGGAGAWAVFGRELAAGGLGALALIGFFGGVFAGSLAQIAFDLGARNLRATAAEGDPAG